MSPIIISFVLLILYQTAIATVLNYKFIPTTNKRCNNGSFRERAPPPFSPEIYHLILLKTQDLRPQLRAFLCYFGFRAFFLERLYPFFKFLDPPLCIVFARSSLFYIWYAIYFWIVSTKTRLVPCLRIGDFWVLYLTYVYN
jgi:hypothetical protein